MDHRCSRLCFSEQAIEGGVVHRDIKPANMLLHDGKAIVADFGIALAISSVGGTRLAQSGISIGTPGHMSHEHPSETRCSSGWLKARTALFNH